MPFQKLKKIAHNASLTRIICFTGLILFVLIGAGYLALSVFGRGGLQRTVQERGFHRMLRDYDLAAANGEKQNIDLNELEEKAASVEMWLSVLKRRRVLAQAFPQYSLDYRQSSLRAVQAYPYSQPLAAIAAAALVMDSSLNREAQVQLRSYMPLLVDPAFSVMRLCLHILLGDFASAETALNLNLLSLPGFEHSARYLSFGSADGYEAEAVAADMAVLKILNGDTQGAASEIQAMVQGAFPLTANFLMFAGEFYYDYGDVLRSAQFFSQIPGEAALGRQADALWLGGYTESARAIWSILAAGEINPHERSLYNLGVTAQNQNEAGGYFEKLVSTPAGYSAGGDESPSRQFGLIRYSRLLPPAQASAFLESRNDLAPDQFPFVDLEILRRRGEVEGLGRTVAETWLLLDRHQENEDLYRWAAWFFDFQQYYSEAEVLLKRSSNYNFDSEWVSLYEAIIYMRHGSLDAALEKLTAIPEHTAQWPVFANLALIHEARLSAARAIDYYERAAAGVRDPKTASRIQLRIAGCLGAAGRSSEARRVLEYALDLDPENVNARLELSRLGY
ncbi:MAG: hypothetical protein FWG99_05380 [Treponema sp.]|nr:hypothetical protein [Treponema sp.]